jgi:hypothetical protein
MLHIAHQTPWIAEEWTCKFTEAKAPYEYFSFEISGSVTGFDGAGKGSEDFVSKSGRVIIKKGDAENDGDWHLKRSWEVMKTGINLGDEVKWKTFSISRDSWQPEAEKTCTLFQGILNASHVLKLEGRNIGAISEMNVFRPYCNR